jgi:hypothetical protein
MTAQSPVSIQEPQMQPAGTVDARVRDAGVT